MERKIIIIDNDDGFHVSCHGITGWVDVFGLLKAATIMKETDCSFHRLKNLSKSEKKKGPRGKSRKEKRNAKK